MERAHRLSLWLWWLVGAALAVILRVNSQGIIEAGDAINHYWMARYAWGHPHMLLDIWGKPLFTLLASPFAQAGQWGMCLFNAGCFVATCWAADGVLRRAGALARWLFPALLLLAPAYGSMVLGGMTEVLFGLLAVLVIRALAEERYAWAAVVCSLMPFSRPEYMAFMPFVALWMAAHKKWSALPLLLLGHVVYAVLCAFAFGDPLWYFHGDPYRGAAHLYGHGEWDHFWIRRDHVLGMPLIWMVVLAVPAASLAWFKQRSLRPSLKLAVWVALIPALCILGLHSVLWWKGLKGSLGLERVLATAVPMLALFAAFGLSGAWQLVRVPAWLNALVCAACTAAYAVAGAQAFWKVRHVPVGTDAYHQHLDAVAEALAVMPEPAGRTIVYHPYILFRMDLDPYDGERIFRSWVGFEDFKPGDRLVWDAHFGPAEAGIPIDRLLGDSTMRVVASYVPKEHLVMYHGATMEVLVFERGNGRREQQSESIVSGKLALGVGGSRMDTVQCSDNKLCFKEGEFPFELIDLAVGKEGACLTELVLSGELEWSDEPGEIQMVFSEELGDGASTYRSFHLNEGMFNHRIRILSRSSDSKNKFYIWNNSQRPFTLHGLRVDAVFVLQED
ncbi:MAG: hypothetical protein WAT74_16430 [Flavobacteriales bacterium]